MKVPINSSIFRDYDIRGIYPSELNEQTYYILGRAVSTYLKVSQIAVGYDARLSSPSLYKNLIRGITDQGVKVIDLGLISTEIHNYASGKYRFPANIIITASHNPAEYNGMKIVTAGVVPLHGGFGLPEIKALSLEQNFSSPSIKGQTSNKNIMDDWIDHILTFADIKVIKKLRVVVDAGNGMGGITWERLKSRIPAEIIPLYFDPDGNFPHHLPDPLKNENTHDLRNKVLSEKADLGLAIDGDADRIFAMDENGELLSGTVTTAILSEHLLTKYGSNTVLYNTACGRIVPETVLKLGGKPIRVRVGHSFIKQYMKKYGAIFAGEHSGHFYFRDNYNAESSAIAGLLLLEYMSLKSMKLSEVRNCFSKYFTSGEISFKVKDTGAVLKSLQEKYQDAQSVDWIDGLSVWYKDWWFNARLSKTEPLLRLNLEADNKDIMENHVNEIKKLISNVK